MSSSLGKTPSTFILNELEDGHNFYDGSIEVYQWRCACGRDYVTVFHGNFDSLDFHCQCGEYWKKLNRIPDEKVYRVEFFQCKKCQLCGKEVVCEDSGCDNGHQHCPCFSKTDDTCCCCLAKGIPAQAPIEEP